MSGKREFTKTTTTTTSNRRRRSVVRVRRRCTMICATFLLCYLFTCCTHLTIAASPAATTTTTDQQPVAGSGRSSSSSSDEFRIEELKHDNVHRLMSEQDLRRTFQVDSHDQVPEYEILKLTVNDDGSHLISPISDLGELTTSAEAPGSAPATASHSQQQQQQQQRSASGHGDGATSSLKTTQTSLDSSQSAGRHKRSANDDDDAAATESEVARDTTLDAKAAAAAAVAPVAAAADTSSQSARQQQQRPGHDGGADADEREDTPIVMELSTFGNKFKLRLKRNADFQRRIKDMKMFMAESTEDGQLRYTEIKSQQQHQPSAARKQEPHKREAGNDDAGSSASANIDTLTSSVSSSSAAAAAAAASVKTSPGAQESTGGHAKSAADKVSSSSSSGPKQQQAANGWNIGSTYHDEDNLAALLIDHDRRTGQLQVDGTIGNDFVIKPMPQATIDALHQAKRQQQQQQLQKRQLELQEQSASSSRLDRLAAPAAAAAPAAKQSATEPQRAAGAPAAAAAAATSGKRQQQLERAIHMHDDDPHDDDEMFLDEDEAIELAQVQASNYTTTPTTNLANLTNSDGSQLPQPGRKLSKAATERKYRKYRKLLAQTQVPKPAQLAAAASASEPSPSRSLPAASSSSGQLVRELQVSHHIVYRQKPSSDGSSSEHQHSFMIAPGQQQQQINFDQLAASFSNLQRLSKRSADSAPLTSEDEDLLAAGASDAANMIEPSGGVDADFLHDPLGGQFYLEPGSMTGVERAGFSDWSLMSGRRMALPPYAINSTASSGNGTARAHGRYKRQAPGGRLPPPPPAGVNHRRKRQAPDTVWPEVLLVVDYDSFLLHGGDSRDVKRYFVSFWNGVDLRYKLLVHPHIRISLAGMIVAKDRDATPYLERNRLRAPNADAVDAAGALTDMGKYLYREDRLPTYDLAVVITKLDMCRRRYEGGRCNRGTAGFAYVGGACVVNKRLEKVNSVAIIEDSGGFSGIIVAAHEVGHLLGCVHDGSPPPSYLGGPGATHCPWEDGFIMSDLRHTERGFRWSQCSVEQFKHFLNGETATCLYNYPHESQMLHRLLPGTMLTLDEQCKRDRGTNACFKDARVCAQLFCFDSASGYCVSYRPAAEGSPCGEGQVCRNGKCVGEIENIIPDYTHQSQTVVARGRGSHGSAARLVDNGLSASSTSTATTSPDGKPNSKATSNAVVVPQLTSRMDTYPIDTPTYSSASYPFGGRYSGGAATGGLSVSAATIVPVQGAMHHSANMKSAKMPTSVAADYAGNGKPQHQKASSQYQQRSGQQAAPKSSSNANRQFNHKQQNLISNRHHSSTALSASTNIPHLYSQGSSASGGNNLLTSASTIPPTNGANQLNKSNKITQQQQQHQPIHDNQRFASRHQGHLNHADQYHGADQLRNNHYHQSYLPSNIGATSNTKPGVRQQHQLYGSSVSPQTLVTS